MMQTNAQVMVSFVALANLSIEDDDFRYFPWFQKER